jgi:hypothetical protein
MTLFFRNLMTTALILVLAAGGLHAEERQLNDADIQKLKPILQAEAATLTASQALSQRIEEARSGFSGDPLEFFRSRTRVDVPEGAKYEPRCSRAASAAGPLVILTFGRNIDCYHRTWRDWARTTKRGPDENLQAPTISQDCRSEGERTLTFLEALREKLQKKGYTVLEWGEASRQLARADGQLAIELEPYNRYDRAESGHKHPLNAIESAQAREAALTACSSIPSGPIIVIRPGEYYVMTGASSTSLDAALKKAGLSEKDYEVLKEALFLARMDVEMGTLQAAEAAAGGDPDMRRALAARQANANLYRKHAIQLGPLLDALVPQP